MSMAKIFNDVGQSDPTFYSKFPEAKEYSITPTTFKMRSTPVQMGDDFTWYKDEFSNNKNVIVTRFGINAAKTDVKTFHSKTTDKKSAELKSSIAPSVIKEKNKLVKHEDLEISIVEKALEHLLAQNQAKVVLVYLLGMIKQIL